MAGFDFTFARFHDVHRAGISYVVERADRLTLGDNPFLT